MVWTIKGVNKSRRFKSRGQTRISHGTTITIPSEVAKLISNDGVNTYMYEHFEKVILTPDEPDDDILYKKIRLNNSSANINGNKRFEISNRFSRHIINVNMQLSNIILQVKIILTP